MGFGRYDSDTFRSYADTNALRSANTTRDDIFTQNREHRINQYLDPKGATVRESRDSDVNPASNAIIVGVDVTGSMGMLSEELVRNGVDALARRLYEAKPVTDPRLMFMGIGDIECDRAPLQVSQFEADIRIIEQLRLMWLEGGGGGNNYESYALPWYFAAFHTAIDCYEKRNKKGFLFTIGDEFPQERMDARRLESVLGYRPQQTDVAEILRLAQEKYQVFHLIAEEGSCFRSYGRRVTEAWRRLLGDNVIQLPNHREMSDVIVRTIEAHAGTPAAVAVAGIGAPGRVVDLS